MLESSSLEKSEGLVQQVQEKAASAKYLAYYGDASQYMLPISVAVVSTILRGAQVGVAFALSTLIQKVQLLYLKSRFKRDRPDGSEGDSFPSGHTANVFISVGFTAAAFSDLAALGLLPFALVTAIERIWNQKHWMSDVSFGAIQGLTNGVLAGLIVQA